MAGGHTPGLDAQRTLGHVGAQHQGANAHHAGQRDQRLQQRHQALQRQRQRCEQRLTSHSAELLQHGAELFLQVGEAARQCIDCAAFCLELVDELVNKLITSNLAGTNHPIQLLGGDTKCPGSNLHCTGHLFCQLLTQFFHLNRALADDLRQGR